MKLEVKQQMLCCLMTVILFLTGMCVELPSANPFFSCTQEISSEEIHFIRESSNQIEAERICTVNMLKVNDETYLSSTGKNAIERFNQSAAILYAVILLLYCVSYFGKAADFIGHGLVSSRETIVHYIQQKDGKK